MSPATPCPHNWPEGRKAEWITRVQCGPQGEPLYIIWQCTCKESVTIQWDEATLFMKEAAKEKAKRGVKQHGTNTISEA